LEKRSQTLTGAGKHKKPKRFPPFKKKGGGNRGGKEAGGVRKKADRVGELEKAVTIGTAKTYEKENKNHQPLRVFSLKAKV